MITIDHQLLNHPYFIPQWECKTLVLGTFNPEGGSKVNYFYGRETNYFWKAISVIDQKNENYYHTQIAFNNDNHIELMKRYHFGCVDIVRSVICPEYFVERITGQGYSDPNLFNKIANKTYNFNHIKEYIINSRDKDVKVTRIINTVGNRFDFPHPREFANILNDFKRFCEEKNIEFFSCPSASGYAVRTHKTEFDDLLTLYKNSLISL